MTDKYRPGRPYGIDDRTGFKERLSRLLHEEGTGWRVDDPDVSHRGFMMARAPVRTLPFVRRPQIVFIGAGEGGYFVNSYFPASYFPDGYFR